MLEAHEAREDAQDVAEFAQAFEAAIGGDRDVGGESQAEQIHEINFAIRVAEANHVAGAPAAFLQRFDRVFDAARVKSRRNELPVPSGRKPSAGRSSVERLPGKDR